ncbi:unnamed protein product [Nezara viridula]|uniref:Uncharacterized protein n=1 Tax=Nezara viridula TaxID=85310 RepID=A0A9P0H019_NEZVI|nr:unnamed protein product [Nezara viridula]
MWVLLGLDTQFDVGRSRKTISTVYRDKTENKAVNLKSGSCYWDELLSSATPDLYRNDFCPILVPRRCPTFTSPPWYSSHNLL